MMHTAPQEPQPPRLIWWEKTVEYKFVMQAAQECQLDLAMPLSGVQERFSDGVFGKNSNVVLIEFKRSVNELDSEKDKFICYCEAHKKLVGSDGHHFLVYGYIPAPPSKYSLALAACTYFGGVEQKAPEQLLAAGIPRDDFNTYLSELAALKKADGRSSGTVGPESLASVIGISTNGKLCEAIPLTEYYARVLPHLYQSPTPTYVPPSPPGMRGA